MKTQTTPLYFYYFDRNTIHGQSKYNDLVKTYGPLKGIVEAALDYMKVNNIPYMDLNTFFSPSK